MVNVDDAIIAKYEYSGEHFEILVDPDLAAERNFQRLQKRR